MFSPLTAIKVQFSNIQILTYFLPFVSLSLSLWFPSLCPASWRVVQSVSRPFPCWHCGCFWWEVVAAALTTTAGCFRQTPAHSCTSSPHWRLLSLPWKPVTLAAYYATSNNIHTPHTHHHHPPTTTPIPGLFLCNMWQDIHITCLLYLENIKQSLCSVECFFCFEC